MLQATSAAVRRGRSISTAVLRCCARSIVRKKINDALRCGPGDAPLRARLMRYGFTQPGAVFETPCF